jgi:hypothetical protein
MSLQGTTFSPLPTPTSPEAGVSDKDCWDKVASLSEIVLAVAQTFAIIVGGIWTWLLFVKKRLQYPRAKVEHYITNRLITEDKALVQVTVMVSNTGDVLLTLISAETWVQKVMPLSDKLLVSIGNGEDPVKQGKTEIEWPLIEDRQEQWERGNCQIEPGENEKFFYDYIVDRKVETIRVYSYFKNTTQRKREIGWSLATIYELTASHNMEKAR